MLFTAVYRMLLASVFGHKDPVSAALSLADQGASRALDFYVQRAEELRVAIDNAAGLQRLYQLSFVVLMALACVLIYESLIALRFPVWTPALIAPALVFAMTRTKRYQEHALKLVRLSEYYGRGVARLNRQWSSLDEGRDFEDKDHFYATDLDLFGHGSF